MTTALAVNLLKELGMLKERHGSASDALRLVCAAKVHVKAACNNATGHRPQSVVDEPSLFAVEEDA